MRVTTTRQYSFWNKSEIQRMEETYTQPLLNFIIFKLFRLFWLASWKFKPLGFVIDKVIDPVLEAWHRRECDDDCVMATRASDDYQFPVCGRLPLDVSLDCKLYFLDTKNSKSISTKRL